MSSGESELGNRPIIVIVGFIAACIAIFTFLTGWQSIRQMLSELLGSTTSTVVPQPESPETTNWTLPFGYRFPSGFWSVGNHEYTLEVVCSNMTWDDSGNRVVNTFEVSDTAELLSDDVYLRPDGLNTALLDGTSIDTIHPSQPTIASAILRDFTREEVELAVKDCHITISWDGGLPQALMGGLPYER